MSDFIDSMKDDPIILGASIAVGILILIIVILIIKLVVESRKEKKKVKTMQKGQINNQVSQQRNNPMNNQYPGQFNPTNNNAQPGYNPQTNHTAQPNYGSPTGPTQQPVNYYSPVQSTPNVPLEPIVENINHGSSGNETMILANEEDVPPTNETMILGENVVMPSAYFTYEVNGQIKKYFIEKPITNIGREAESCDFVMSFDSHVGRKHALVYSKDNKYILVDLNSRNGTFVNGEKLLGERQLSNGDKIKLAVTEMTFSIN